MAMLVTHSLTNSLTDSRLVNLIDVTLACEDANSKLVEVFTVADVDAKKHVDNSSVHIWKLKFSHKIKILCQNLVPKPCAQSLDKNLKLNQIFFLLILV